MPRGLAAQRPRCPLREGKEKPNVPATEGGRSWLRALGPETTGKPMAPFRAATSPALASWPRQRQKVGVGAERKEWTKEEGMREWEAGLTRGLSQV